jgi:ferredoxin
MFRLKLDADRCVCCGICMDLCAPQAITMKPWQSVTVEGEVRTCQTSVTTAKSSFPRMSRPELCDGCARCVEQCPVCALELRVEPAAIRALLTTVCWSRPR